MFVSVFCSVCCVEVMTAVNGTGGRRESDTSPLLLFIGCDCVVAALSAAPHCGYDESIPNDKSVDWGEREHDEESDETIEGEFESE